MASIEKRGDGYRITVYDSYNDNGRQVKRHKTWKPSADMTEYQIKKELERQCVAFEQECKSGQTLSGAIKLKEYIELWFDKYAVSHLRQTTLENYHDLSKRVYKELVHIRIDRLNPNDLNKFYASLMGYTPQNHNNYALKFDFKSILSERNISYRKFAEMSNVGIRTVNSIASGDNVSLQTAHKIADCLKLDFEKYFKPANNQKGILSSKTVKHYHSFLSSALSKAVKWGYIKDNPCDRVDPPRIQHKQIKCFTTDEAKIFLKGLSQECLKYRVMFSILIYTGLRRGELLGLEWSDINFEKKTMSISRTSVHIRSKGIVTDTTKNEYSIREISISDELIELLKLYYQEQQELKAKLGDMWVETNRICIRDDGSPMGIGTPYNTLQKLLKKYKSPDISLHSLRHTNATIMIESGTDLKTTSARLGHSQASTTMNIYVHQIKSSNEHAAENISKALSIA